MFGRRKVRAQLTFLLFFIITPKFKSSARYDPRWAEPSLINGNAGSSWSYRHKQCSGEDGKCSSSSQCCHGLVCLQAGYSDGHCIKKTSLQPCSRSRECPEGCVCEVMGLKVDGVAGFCVAKLDLSTSDRAFQDGNRLRTGLRTGVGGVSGPDRGPLQSQPTRESTMEKVYGVVENDKFKVDELKEMIERLEIASEPRRNGGNRRDRSYLPPRSVSYFSVRNARPSAASREEMVAELAGLTNADGTDLTSDNLSPRERYELFCKWLKMTGKAGDRPIEVSNRAAVVEGDVGHYRAVGTHDVRRGQSCTRSEECASAGSLDRWQVCCARVNILRHGIRLVCEKISAITRCVDWFNIHG